jgi:nicotinamidase-related amidase
MEQTDITNIDPKKIAVVLIDFQNAFCHENSFEVDDKASNRATALRANEFAQFSSDFGATVVYTRQIYRSDQLTSRQNKWAKLEGLCKDGTWESELFLKPIEGSIIISKFRYDVWQSSEFLTFLREHNPDAFIFAGVELCCCILYAVLGADERGYRYLVPQDLISGIDFGADSYNRNIREFLRAIHHAPESIGDIRKQWKKQFKCI